MVHALGESWRVLHADGILIDIRPHLGNMRLEVLSDTGHQLVGLIEDIDLIPDHQAAHRALDHGATTPRVLKYYFRQFSILFSLLFHDIGLFAGCDTRELLYPIFPIGVEPETDSS